MPELPEEAVELHARTLVERVSQERYHGRLKWDDVYPTNQERNREKAREELGLVAPAIRQQVREPVEAELTDLRESLLWALTWIVGEARLPADVGGLPSDQEAFDKADKLVSATLEDSDA